MGDARNIQVKNLSNCLGMELYAYPTEGKMKDLKIRCL